MVSSSPSWEQILQELSEGHELEISLTHWAMNQILNGQASTDEIKSFLLALRSKGETANEVQALVGSMYEHAQLDFHV